MKNQYFGDINDYRKYGLLRLLTGYGLIKTGVCWMLTPNDDRPGGSLIMYLYKPDRWRKFDPDLYDYLRESVIVRRIRDIRVLEEPESAKILPHCRFYSKQVPEEGAHREQYFRTFLEDYARSAELIFFDPDNGMEVQSISPSKGDVYKYLCWSEVRDFFSIGRSLLVYQHFPRYLKKSKTRADYVGEVAQLIRVKTDCRCIYSYCGGHVVFFLISQPNHQQFFSRANRIIEKDWDGKIRVISHKIA